MVGMEKRILREAFNGYLPDDILWRQKDGMSDAVGTNWVDEIKRYAENNVDDLLFKETRLKARGHNVSLTKEEALYRNMFWKMYGSPMIISYQKYGVPDGQI